MNILSPNAFIVEDLILPTRLKNTNWASKDRPFLNDDKDLITYDRLFLPSKEDVKKDYDERLKHTNFKNIPLFANRQPTDFAILSGTAFVPKTSQPSSVSNFAPCILLRSQSGHHSDDHDMITYDKDIVASHDTINTKFCAIPICMNLNKDDVFMKTCGFHSLKKESNWKQYPIAPNNPTVSNFHFIFGEFPQWIADENTSAHLNKLEKQKAFFKMDNPYTNIPNDCGMKVEKVVKYKDKKYVKMAPASHLLGKTIILSNGKRVKVKDYMWVEISPIHWHVKNYHRLGSPLCLDSTYSLSNYENKPDEVMELCTANPLLGGIDMCAKSWSESNNLKNYLNGYSASMSHVHNPQLELGYLVKENYEKNNFFTQAFGVPAPILTKTQLQQLRAKDESKIEEVEEKEALKGALEEANNFIQNNLIESPRNNENEIKISGNPDAPTEEIKISGDPNAPTENEVFNNIDNVNITEQNTIKFPTASQEDLTKLFGDGNDTQSKKAPENNNEGYFSQQMVDGIVEGLDKINKNNEANMDNNNLEIVEDNPTIIDDKKLTIQEQIEFYVKNGISFMLHGLSGIGKSSRVRSICPENFVSVALTDGILPEEIKGKTIYPVGEPSYWEPPYWYRQIVENCNKNPDKYIPLFIDELTNVDPHIQSLAYDLVQYRTIAPNQGPLPKNCVVVAAGNDKKDSASAYAMAEPLFRKFAAHIYIPLSVEEFIKYGSKPSTNDPTRPQIHPVITQFVATYGKKVLHSDYDKENPPKYVVDPRGWEQVSDIIYASGNKLIKDLIHNKIGNELSTSLIAFAKRPMLTLNTILSGNYNKNNIPRNIDEQLALALSLTNVPKEHLGKVLSFIHKNLNKEVFQTFLSEWIGDDKEKALYINNLIKQGLTDTQPSKSQENRNDNSVNNSDSPRQSNLEQESAKQVADVVSKSLGSFGGPSMAWIEEQDKEQQWKSLFTLAELEDMIKELEKRFDIPTSSVYDMNRLESILMENTGFIVKDDNMSYQEIYKKHHKRWEYTNAVDKSDYTELKAREMLQSYLDEQQKLHDAYDAVFRASQKVLGNENNEESTAKQEEQEIYSLSNEELGLDNTNNDDKATQTPTDVAIETMKENLQKEEDRNHQNQGDETITIKKLPDPNDDEIIDLLAKHYNKPSNEHDIEDIDKAIDYIRLTNSNNPPKVKKKRKSIMEYFKKKDPDEEVKKQYELLGKNNQGTYLKNKGKNNEEKLIDEKNPPHYLGFDYHSGQ